MHEAEIFAFQPFITFHAAGCVVTGFAFFISDFHAVDAMGKTWLIQSCADASDPETFESEVRSLLEAKAQYPEAKALLLLLAPLTAGFEMPEEICCTNAIEWFLEKAD